MNVLRICYHILVSPERCSTVDSIFRYQKNTDKYVASRYKLHI